MLSSQASKILKGSLVLFFLGAACSTEERPNVELVLAREAFAAATEVEASKYASGYYHRAEEAYHRAMTSYQQHQFKEAITDFRVARVFAERAENAACVQRQKRGEEGL